MAIAQRGSATIGYGGAGSCAVSVPAGVVDGDVLIVFLGNDSGTAGTLGGLTGWTLVRDDNDGGGVTLRLASYRRVASSEPASYTFTCTGALPLGGVMTAWSGVDTTTPTDGSNGTVVSGSAGTTISAPSVTTATANGALLCAYMLDNGGANMTSAVTITLPGGLTDQGGMAPSGTGVVKLRAGSKSLGAAGATGAQGATNTSEPARAGQQVALRAAAGAATSLPPTRQSMQHLLVR